MKYSFFSIALFSLISSPAIGIDSSDLAKITALRLARESHSDLKLSNPKVENKAPPKKV